jgi:hypothetical protein
MVNLNKNNLAQKHKEAEMHPMLSQFVVEVSLIKPLFEFHVNDDCVGNYYDNDELKTQINKVHVRQDGENLGYLSVSREYRNRESISVYGVGSFRINKSRGRHDETLTKDLKVALRNVKKLLIGRDYTEIANLIKSSVADEVQSLFNRKQHTIGYSINNGGLQTSFATLAYQAMLDGKDSITIPAINKFVKDSKEFRERVAEYLEVKALQEMIEDRRGYGVSVYSNGSCAVYDFSNAGVRRFKSMDDLPDDIKNRLPMFKMMDMHEANALFGIKLQGDMYYIVSGELKLNT